MQLGFAPEPDVLFSDYAYVSSVSSTWVAHCQQHVDSLIATGLLSVRSTVVEVASNDGYLLDYLRAQGIRCFGVEPAANLAAVANDNGNPTFNEFMGRSAAEKITAETGAVDLVIANNVLAHVPDPVDFLSGISHLLGPGGLVSIESPYAADLIAGNQFDTVYHEHIFYLTTSSVDQMARLAGLRLVRLEQLPTHGGSRRWWLAPNNSSVEADGTVIDELEREAESDNLGGSGLARFSRRTDEARSLLLSAIDTTTSKGGRWAAYGAAAKGVVLANFSALTSDHIEFVIDNNPLKQGKVLPGTDIPVRPLSHLIASRHITDVLVMPWNIQSEIAAQIDASCDWSPKKWIAIPKVTEL